MPRRPATVKLTGRGGARPGAGRKKGSTTAPPSQVIYVRLPDPTAATARQRAQEAGQELSAWVRGCVEREIERDG